MEIHSVGSNSATELPFPLRGYLLAVTNQNTTDGKTETTSPKTAEANVFMIMFLTGSPYRNLARS